MGACIYNATIAMCRRALESSCLERGAPATHGTLQKMIERVVEQEELGAYLHNLAHQVRLGGDRGMHPSTKVIKREDADAVIDFTWSYFEALYVTRARMKKHDLSRPKTAKK